MNPGSSYTGNYHIAIEVNVWYVKSYEIQSMTGDNKAWFTEAAAYRMQTGQFILARLF